MTFNATLWDIFSAVNQEVVRRGFDHVEINYGEMQIVAENIVSKIATDILEKRVKSIADPRD